MRARRLDRRDGGSGAGCRPTRRVAAAFVDDLLAAVEFLSPRILEAIDGIGHLDHALGDRLRRMAEDLQYAFFTIC
jgi:hypothetical protein